ncbi:F0F1 ATP synthase subunit epsilon [Henriciella sp.]|uniref:F0F1 ATP synthase subunit epsilon n=1 Tax=Henriciella sp. TaxID=1968823 RepID=UPI0026146C83|nr:F0F1 ATP synthase subunit epsilon [Henriciella sp.]
MADKLHFSLVSPAKELFSGEVDHVIAPGTEGEFGVLAHHAPFMTTLKNGVVRVLDGDTTKMRLFVRGGFADVTPAGLTILAEEAVDLGSVDAATVESDLEEARSKLLSEGKDGPHVTALQAQVDYLTDLKAAVVH